MNSNEYTTKDIGEAGALYASKQKFLRLDKGDGFYWFVFEDYGAKSISTSFWCGDLVVKAKEYYEALRTLKTLIYSHN